VTFLRRALIALHRVASEWEFSPREQRLMTFYHDELTDESAERW
jgi:hypothetical protein